MACTGARSLRTQYSGGEFADGDDDGVRCGTVDPDATGDTLGARSATGGADRRAPRPSQSARGAPSHAISVDEPLGAVPPFTMLRSVLSRQLGGRHGSSMNVKN
jgi:hypothetical protein